VDKGLVIVFTGDGKGKTSAALGVSFRAFGHKMPVCIVQFIKGPSVTGESRAAERIGPEMEFVSLGRGFVTGQGKGVLLSEHQEAAAEALALARQRMVSGSCDILVLDEINYAVQLGLIDSKAVLELIRSKPPKLHMVLTGRNAHPEIIAAADMVTEMRSLKHPFDSGIPARRGIDY
jgi:cob(I)alamin adenosyltransferase